MVDKHTVVVVLEAKEGKEQELRDALTAVVNPSRCEDTNIEYRLHTVKDNPAQFILFENWNSQDEHALQFEKPYIKDLGDKLEDLLAKPFDYYFAEELMVEDI